MQRDETGRKMGGRKKRCGWKRWGDEGRKG
jgi:hypothetical protein